MADLKKKLIHSAEEIDTHLSDTTIHVTADDKEKLNGLVNYDDTEILKKIAALEARITALEGASAEGGTT